MKIKLWMKYWALYYWKSIILLKKRFKGNANYSSYRRIIDQDMFRSIYNKWENWTKDEIWDYPTLPNTNVNDYLIQIIAKNEHKKTMMEIDYQSDTEDNFPDNTDHWKVSSETIRDGVGDCEDIAILLYRRIVQNYKISGNCFVCGVSGHAFVVVEDNDGVYWMFDNGKYTMKVEKLNIVLPYYDKVPKIMFTREQIFKIITIES